MTYRPNKTSPSLVLKGIGSALLLAGAAIIVPTGASAQGAGANGASESSASDTSSNDIVVTALKPDTTSGLDRKIYRVENDIQSLTGTAVEVLNKVPSVDVDTNGSVSLRGDSSVTILIDGRPTNQGSGDDGLSQIQARDIERIEVITNPPAEYKAAGSGGVINIRTKKTRAAGLSGTVQTNIGERDRGQIGLSVNYKTGGLNLSGSLGYKQDTRLRDLSQDRRLLDPASGDLFRNGQSTRFRAEQTSPSAKLGADYNFQNGDTIGFSASRNERRDTRLLVQSNDTSTDAGAPLRAYVRTGTGRQWRLDADESIYYERKMFADDDLLKLSVQQSSLRQRDVQTYNSVFSLPITAPTAEQYVQNYDLVKTDVSADYELPLEKATIKLGYNFEHNDNRFLNAGGTFDPAVSLGAVTPANTNDFRYALDIHAAYGSVKTTAWGLEVQAGLRVEQSEETTRLIQGDVRSERDSLRAYPSVHISKDLTDSDKVSFSLSRRITRVDPKDLNPFPDQRDTRNLRAGNPNLKPKDTQSFEVGYEHDEKDFGYRLTGYYRINHNSTTDVTRILSDDVVLNTKTNLARDVSGGVEFGVNGKLLKNLSYNLNGNVYYAEIDAASAGGIGLRSNVTGTGKLSFDYKATKQDAFQISTVYTGERLTAQGSILPTTVVNLGYRHQFAETLAGVITVTDLFQGQKNRRRLDTPTLQDTFERQEIGPIVYVGFTYTFGGKAKTKDSGFKYDQPNDVN